MDPDIEQNGAIDAPTPPDLGLNTGAPETIANDIGTHDFSELPALESLHIDEIEPPSPSEEAAPSPVTPMPAPSGTSFRSPRASKASKTFRSHGNKVAPESMRARAEEVNSGSKLVPKIEEEVGDFFGLEIEISTWFGECMTSMEFAEYIDSLQPEAESPNNEIRNLIYQLLVHRSAASVSEALNSLVEQVIFKQETWLNLMSESDQTESFDDHTLFFLCLCAWASSEKCSPLLDKGVGFISALLKQIATLRWFVEFEDEDSSSTKLLSRLFMILRVALLATFGDSKSLRDTQAAVWRTYELEKPENEDEYASPINYAEFMEEVSKRYPSFILQLDDSDCNLGARLRKGKYAGSSMDGTGLGNSGMDDGYDPADPRDLVNNQNLVMPYVPHSIIEACELYKSRVRTSPAIRQLHEVQSQTERDLQVALGATLDEVNPGGGSWAKTLNEVPAVKAVNDLYSQTLGVQKSVARVIVDFVMHAGKEGPTPSIHAGLASLWYLLNWFRASHVLMFEHMAALLFDCQFHLVAHLFCSGHSRVPSYVLDPYMDGKLFWSMVTSPNTEYDGPIMNWSTKDTAQFVIPHFNKYKLQTFTYLVGVSRLMVTGKTQRLLVVAELPVDPFKPLFSLYESELWLQLLLYMKAQVPFTGKRWRYLNMELISAIYLYCPSRIDDNWLSGSDVTQVVRNAPTEEATLREMIEQFNDKF